MVEPKVTATQPLSVSKFISKNKNCFALIIFSILFKILLFPIYHSTDFEVHRNWLAITHSLPIKQWYYENTSEWTLDYPPFFAYFELVLSQPAAFIDANMLNVTNLNYKSPGTINYQRMTVVITEFVLVYALIKFLNQFNQSPNKKLANTDFLLDRNCYLTVQTVLNFALIMIDNIHFQYNGFMFGIMMLSIYHIQQENWLWGSFLFSSLINFKHIYLYIAPAFFFYILFFYCLKAETILSQFSRLIKIGIVAIVPFVFSIGPFIYMNQIPQLISRLFPFKRGLCHAYWAPNFWAVYNFVDKALSIALKRKQVGSSSTSGLVQDIDHVVLPSIPPIATFISTLVFIMVPTFVYIYKNTSKKSPKDPSSAPAVSSDALIILTIICGYASFLFGWHVHEKAVLMILIPLSFISVKDSSYAELYFIMSFISNYSLFPLIFRSQEYPIKLLCFITFSYYNYTSLKYQFKDGFNLDQLSTVAVYGMIFLESYKVSIHYILSIDAKLPYLPLMLTSIYCALFVIICWLKFLYLVLLKK